MSDFLNDMISDFNYMFNNIDKIQEKKPEFIKKYINNREKLLSELQKEVDIYKRDKSNKKKIDKLTTLFWQIQTNEIITLPDEPSKKTCQYDKNCYRLNISHNINEYNHYNNNFNNLASRIAAFLSSLDDKISLQENRNKKRTLSSSKTKTKKRPLSGSKTKTKKRKIGGNYKNKSYKKKSYKKKSYKNKSYKNKSYKKRLKKKI